jgi:hypothetical protein
MDDRHQLVDKITFNLHRLRYNDVDSDEDDYDDDYKKVEIHISKTNGYLLKEKEENQGLIMFHHYDSKYNKKICCCVVSSDKYEKTMRTAQLKKNAYHTIVNNYANMKEGMILQFDDVPQLMVGVPSKTYMRDETATYRKREILHIK